MDAATHSTGRKTSTGWRGLLGDHALVADAHLWPRRDLLVAAGLWLFGALVLAALSVAAHRYPEFPGDVGITTIVQQIRSTPLAPLINFASDVNWPTPAGITALVVIVLLALSQHIRAAICTAVASFGADLANVMLNGLVARPRPQGIHIHVVAHLGLHSFPSGHVTHVVGFYGFLFYLSLRAERGHPAWRPWLLALRAICLYFLIAIGISRLLEGEHWPSDVLASYVLGALVLALAILLYHLLAVAWVHVEAARHHHAPAAAHE